MLPELLAAAAEMEARHKASAPPPREIECAFPEQRAYVYDDSQLQAAFCTRRAAKSYSGGLKAFRVAGKYPRCAVLIAGLHRLEIKRIYWEPILRRIDEEQGIGAKFNETELTCRLPNGSIIYLLGMDANEKEKRKALGQKFPLVLIDEAQDWVTDVNTLVFHVLKPAVADYRGQICLQGTPGLIAKGLFFDVTTGKEPGWKLHEWTTYDNLAPSPDGSGKTCAQQWHDEIEELKRLKPGVELTPAFRRNYLREWVVDEDKRVYRYASPRNDFTELPTYPRGDWHYVLGCDLGYTDATSFVVCAYHDHDRALYVVEAHKESGMDVTAVARRTKALLKKYDFDALIIDNANKQAVEEMVRRHEIPWRAADKTGKADFIELMNGDLIVSRVKLGPAAQALKEEYAGLIWDEKSAKKQEHPACENHCADGALYAWRYCYSYLSEPLVVRPKEGTAEWAEEQEDAMEQAAVAKYEAEEEDTGAWGQ